MVLQIMVMSFQNHEFSRVGRFVKRNGPDTGAILTQNVIPVISVQSILHQLPYGAKKKCWTGFFLDFSINYTNPYRTPKKDPPVTIALLGCTLTFFLHNLPLEHGTWRAWNHEFQETLVVEL